MNQVASHLDLIAAARSLSRCAIDEAPEQLHDILATLRNDLLLHLLAENPDVDQLPGATPAVVRDGQRAILRLIDDLIFASQHRVAECSCIARTAEVGAALRRQAQLESALLARHPPRTRPQR